MYHYYKNFQNDENEKKFQNFVNCPFFNIFADSAGSDFAEGRAEYSECLRFDYSLCVKRIGMGKLGSVSLMKNEKYDTVCGGGSFQSNLSY